MRIVFLNDGVYQYASGSPSAVGGAERQQWLLARALAASGWSVSVGIFNELKAAQRVTVDGVNFVGIKGGRTHALADWGRFLASEGATWLYWRGANHLLGPIVALAKGLGIRTIFSAAVDSDVTPRTALFQHPKWWRLYALGLSWSDKIFVQHGGQLNALTFKLRLKTAIMPSIAGEAIMSRSHHERIKFIAWVGQLRQPKRPDLLVDIARQLSEVHFVVCGGPCTFKTPPVYTEKVIDALRSLPNVDYRGQVAPQIAQSVIGDAAALLSTSDEEGFPNTFLQAWSCGTPVISLKIDPDDVIATRELGSISGNIETAIWTIESLIQAPDQRDYIAERAKRYIAEHHSEAAVTAAFNRALNG